MKPRWKSKTYWFNAIIGAAALAEQHINLLKPMLGDKVYGLALFVLIIGNFILREMTTQPVGSSNA